MWHFTKINSSYNYHIFIHHVLDNFLMEHEIITCILMYDIVHNNFVVYEIITFSNNLTFLVDFIKSSNINAHCLLQLLVFMKLSHLIIMFKYNIVYDSFLMIHKIIKCNIVQTAFLWYMKSPHFTNIQHCT